MKSPHHRHTTNKLASTSRRATSRAFEQLESRLALSAMSPFQRMEAAPSAPRDFHNGGHGTVNEAVYAVFSQMASRDQHRDLKAEIAEVMADQQTEIASQASTYTTPVAQTFSLVSTSTTVDYTDNNSANVDQPPASKDAGVETRVSTYSPNSFGDSPLATAIASQFNTVSYQLTSPLISLVDTATSSLSDSSLKSETWESTSIKEVSDDVPQELTTRNTDEVDEAFAELDEEETAEENVSDNYDELASPLERWQHERDSLDTVLTKLKDVPDSQQAIAQQDRNEQSTSDSSSHDKQYNNQRNAVQDNSQSIAKADTPQMMLLDAEGDPNFAGNMTVSMMAICDLGPQAVEQNAELSVGIYQCFEIDVEHPQPIEVVTTTINARSAENTVVIAEAKPTL